MSTGYQMQTPVEHNSSQWQGLTPAVNNWLNERQQLLVDYCQIAGLSANKIQQNQQLPDHSALNGFCQLMVDYVSAGHFEIFELLAAHDKQGEALKHKLFPEIMDTTEYALHFNDRYSDFNHETDNESDNGDFDHAIAKLGEMLAVRFELEDQLIQHLSDLHTKPTPN